MSRYTGAVRFPDGELRYFVYNGTVDIARRELFGSADEADAAWDAPADRQIFPLCDGEPVEVMPYYCHGNQEVLFYSRADRDQGVITGPVSAEEAQRSLPCSGGSTYLYGED